MNDYQASDLIKALGDIAGSMPDASEIKDALGDVYNALDFIGDKAGEATDVLVGIHEQLTQISNTLARTMGREETRFITVHHLIESNVQANRWRPEVISVANIVRVVPDETNLPGAYVWNTRGDILRVRETVEEITTMINAGAYVPPF